MVTGKKHMLELSTAPELSIKAVYADDITKAENTKMFGLKYHINNMDHNEQTNLRTRLYGKVLRLNAPEQLAVMDPALRLRLESSFEAELFSGQMRGESVVALAPMIRKVTSGLMALLFFGEQLSSEPEFASALLDHSHDIVTSLKMNRLMPAFLHKTLTAIATRNGHAMRILTQRLRPIVGHAGGLYDEPEPVKSHTLLQTVLEETNGKEGDYWTPEILLEMVMGMFFAASHQPWSVSIQILRARLS
ncbi:hypothetical protein OEA41_010813 [Lepraria neglecta]|uniref:Cytochrome P450 n=1 Tax=Lepraria neglecta TaxID=209136 RepID=A0AAD9YXB9_9LECA|nr:hypothetical protein OEA41_010813 [Lepraria neglecta]